MIRRVTMSEEKMSEQERTASPEAPVASGASGTSSASSEAEANRRIPGTTGAVMIFILLVAFACAGVQVVTNMIEDKYAPEEIKGKENLKPVEYPILHRLPEGIAAEVNGVEIPESTITDMIMSLRHNVGLDDQEAWDEWMIETNNTTETLRNRFILYNVNAVLVDQMAEELGVEPTEEDLQVTRDEIYSSPEAIEMAKEQLAQEGRTLEDYETDIVTLTKKRLIGEKYNEGITENPEFQETVLSYIKQGYPEYAEAESLDQVDPDIVSSVTQEMKAISDTQAFSNYVRDFLLRSDVFYSKMGSDLPYKSNSDTYFMKEEMKAMLKKNGLISDEGSVFDELMSDMQSDQES